MHHDITTSYLLFKTTNRQIDALVYELYGLTEEEVGIIENR
jgi:hypothetical protein